MKSKQYWHSKWLDGDFGTTESFIDEIQVDSYNQCLDDLVSDDLIPDKERNIAKYRKSVSSTD